MRAILFDERSGAVERTERVMGGTMRGLVAVDSSSSYASVVNDVVSSAWPAGTSFYLLSVVEPSYRWNVARLEDGPKEAADDLVRLAVKRLQDISAQCSGMVKP